MLYDANSFWKGFTTSILTFQTINYILLKTISHKDKREQWKRVNIATSFIHATFSSIVTVLCFIESPEMCTTDIISSFTPHAYLFISFEIGYFVFDSIDLLRKSSGKQRDEVLLHHFTIFVCFGISLSYGRYIGYAILSLFLEINSIFLHSRRLLLFWDVPRCSIIYRINNVLNFITFIIFRFGVVTYMNVWLIGNRSNLPLSMCFIGQIGLIIMSIINLMLFYRLIKTDFRSI